MSVTIGVAWRQVRDRFRAAGIETPDLDARFLAEAVLGLERGALVRCERDTVATDARERLEAAAARRLAGEPVARILGEKEFFGLGFGLNAATLVPRPETELVVSAGLGALAGNRFPSILDLGTGSGCIAIALLANLPEAQATAVDLSVEALDAARANAVRHAVADRLSLAAGRWFDPLGSDDRFDLIVANPPYVETGTIAGLQVEVRDFDPILALDGGADGLDAYRVILAGAGRHLAPGGTMVLEIGAGQGAAVAGLGRDCGFRTMRLEKDVGGLDRAVVVHHSSSQ